MSSPRARRAATRPVRAPNIGNTEPSENSQGKGRDLQSKYYPTLTVARKAYWALAVRRNAPDGPACYRISWYRPSTSLGDLMPRQVIMWSLIDAGDFNGSPRARRDRVSTVLCLSRIAMRNLPYPAGISNTKVWRYIFLRETSRCMQL